MGRARRAPPLPVGITGMKPGAQQRTFDLVGIQTHKPGDGLDLGILGDSKKLG